MQEQFRASVCRQACLVYPVLYRRLSAHEERELVDVLQCDARSLGDGMQGVFGNVEGDVYLVRQSLVQSAQQGTSSGQVDTVVHEVGIFSRQCAISW